MAGIYVHVPFCTVKCAYCDFYSVARSELAGPYADAVANEYSTRKHELGNQPITTLYFGGGTPSLLSDDIFDRIASLFPKTDIEEFTIEANPDDINSAFVERRMRSGVNRVSIGVQSLDDEVLHFIGRRHNGAQALDAVDCLKSAGISNISADLIYGLPGQTPSDFAADIDSLISKGITHLSAYCLSYEPGTRLWQRLKRGLTTEIDDETIAAEYDLLCRAMKNAGFEHYEISNFALPGYRSRHNSSYWRGTPYLGLGPGAHSLDIDGIRRFVAPDVKAYIADSTQVLHIDHETRADKVNDAIMTGLRTIEGFDTGILTSDELAAVSRQARKWLVRGKLHSAGNRLFIAPADWLVSDTIIADLFIDSSNE